jgi:hypothetical protein
MAGLQPKIRLLFFALEAAFAYVFWAMKAVVKDYGMGHICPWDRDTLEYDGLCSHCSLYEGPSGDFELSAEELEALAVQRKEILAEKKGVRNSNHHHKQMETNYHEYRDKKNAVNATLKAKDGGEKHRQNYRDNAAKNHAKKTHYCELCKRSFPMAGRLRDHKKSKPHLNKADELANNRYQCTACAKGFATNDYLQRHLKTNVHLKVLAALSSSELD